MTQFFIFRSNEDLFEQLFPKNDHDLQLARRLLVAISQLSPNQKNSSLFTLRAGTLI